MGEPINKAIFVDYKGQRVYFCCNECRVQFKKDPEKYQAKIKENGEVPAKAPATAESKHEGPEHKHDH